MVVPHKSCNDIRILSLLAAAAYVPVHHSNSPLSLKQAEICTTVKILRFWTPEQQEFAEGYVAPGMDHALKEIIIQND